MRAGAGTPSSGTILRKRNCAHAARDELRQRSLPWCATAGSHVASSRRALRTCGPGFTLKVAHRVSASLGIRSPFSTRPDRDLASNIP